MAYPTPASSEIEQIEMENQRSPLATWDGASSSSTAADSLRCVNKYDVFINHRGEVKNNFASHLYRALLSRGLKPFLDQQDLQEGLPFPSQLEAVISNVSLHVAIFSPKYAESRWCLDELLLMRQSGVPIIPVFYHVNPVDLRWGVYALSLQELELKKTLDSQTQQEKLRYDPATIQKWRDALSSVADINGFDLNGKYNGDKVYMIDQIVEHVVKIIKPRLYVAQYPAGLDEKVTDFEATVFKQQHDGKIQVAGIVGLGGMGKTTLALELFNRMSSKYNTSYFLADVREKANKSSLHSVQRELLRGLTQGLPERELDIDSIYEGIGKFEKHLKSAHVLLILDDIDHEDQLEALLPVKDFFRLDSFILITSRYKDVLERSGIEELCIYKLTGLPRKHSQELFCSSAFCQTNALHGFEDLVDQFLEVCHGMPLALKVIGALLFRQPVTYWDAKLFELKVQGKVSSDIKSRLKISYDALSTEERKMFLDIAFFFIGKNKTSAIIVWDASGWNGLLGFTNLEGKCLVEVDDQNVIHMHDQLRNLGREIAEDESPRRLWRPTGNMNINDWLHKYSSVIMEARGIRMLGQEYGMERLAWYQRWSHQMLGNRVILKLRNRLSCFDVMNLQLVETQGHLNLQLVETQGHLLDRILRVHSPNLLWLSWRHCPYTRLPSWITTKNLRVLRVEGGVLETLWQGKSQAPLQLQELEIIDASCVSRIRKSIGQLKHLERIVIECPSLAKLPEEFGNLNSLKALVLHAPALKSLPNSFGKLRNLYHMDLSTCFQLERLPDSFGSLTNLHSLNVSSCTELERLPDSFGSLSNIHSLDLSRSFELERLPDSFGSLSNLHSLDLSHCYQLERLPDSFGSLSNLHRLGMYACKRLERLPDSFGSLGSLEYFDVSEAANLRISSETFGNIRTLRHIGLTNCEKVEVWPWQLGHQRSLKVLKLTGTNFMEELPRAFDLPSDLEVLWIGNPLLDTVIPSLGDLRNLKDLHLEFRGELKCLSASVERSSELSWLKVCGCPIIHTSEVFYEDNVVYPKLEKLILQECFDLAEVGTLPKALRYVTLDRCYNLRSIEGVSGLPMLKELILKECINLAELGTLPKALTSVTLDRCYNLRSIEGLSGLPMLKEVSLIGCDNLRSIEGVCGLPRLRWVTIKRCNELQVPPSAEERLKQNHVFVVRL